MEKIIQITAGKGSAECQWVVAQVVKLFLEGAKENGLKYGIIHREPGSENRTLQSIVISLKGEHIEAFLKDWLGTVQWIGASKLRKHHKRRNWFIGVFEMEQARALELNEKDIVFQTMRSTGPGGQHVNKVNSAVRATHIPTGVSVVAMNSRSQHQNKKLAMQRLKEKIDEVNLEQMKKMTINQWENHLNLERGNPVKVFKGTNFKHQKKKISYKSKRQELKNDLRNKLKN
ncbi:peptide chain release factor H [Flavobacteriaceae bacterium R38]|nr:peptide chain release factor H [Flavobacteriaceae bacterium R38]